MAGDTTDATGARWRVAVAVCGAALLAWLIAEVGASQVLASFRTLSWRLAVVVVFPSIVLKALDVLAWQLTFPEEHVPLPPLASALLAGQAVGATPASVIGGNALMAWKLRGRVRLRETLSSLIIVQTTSTASQGLFLLTGILVARATLPLSSTLLRAMEWLLVLEVIGVAGFVLVQMRGVVAGGYGLLGRLGIAGGRAAGTAAEHIDRALADYYRSQPRRLTLSLACNLLGWFTRAGETWLILSLLHAGVSVGTALVIEAFGTGISFATFFLPMDLGVEEGGAVAAFLALGLSASIGLSFGLVRRIRELAWAAVGLMLLAGEPMPPRTALDVKAA